MVGPERPTHSDIVVCADGPILVRGDVVIEDANGVRHRTHRPVSAVCRCGQSAIPPWCDGTHKLLNGDAAP